MPSVGALPNTAPLDELSPPIAPHDRIETKADDPAYEVGMNDKGEKVQLDLISSDEERKVLRKIDLIVLPLFFLIYGFQYLDKIGRSVCQCHADSQHSAMLLFSE